MFPVGGVGAMLAGIAASGLACAVLAWASSRRLGWVTAASFAVLVWSVCVIGLVTLLPAQGAPGYVGVDEHSSTCSLDLGGPAPDGFWILSGGQRLLNVLVFVPPAAALVVWVARWRIGWVLAPLGLVTLAAYSVLIELTQLELARLDRACDVTDVVDNVTGAGLGVLLGAGLAVVLRPWRRRRPGAGRSGPPSTA